MYVEKIQDTGEAPLRGRQEEYWLSNVEHKYNRLRPGFKFKFRKQSEILSDNAFKAFEYGHWTTQNERIDFLAAADASFHDLNSILKLKNLGFGKIGIAFGARGKGGFAAAHFEPSTFMINLTRTKGFGAFAHEYGHALDYLLGGYYEQSKESFSLSTGRLFIHDINNEKKGSLRFEMIDLLISVKFSEKGIRSESYRNWQKAYSDDYWFRSTEVFARVFEQYIFEKLAEKKIYNGFLNSRKYEEKAYLTAKDYQRIKQKMKKLLDHMSKISKS